MIAALILSLMMMGPAQAQDDDPCKGLHPCEPSSVDTGEGAGELMGAVAADEPEALAAEVVLSDERPPYWYEPLTDLFWVPGEILHFAGIVGEDHVDIAAHTTWIGAVAAMSHRLAGLMWAGWMAPVWLLIRRRVGWSTEPAEPQDVVEEIAVEVQSQIKILLAETHRQINQGQTQNMILQKRIEQQTKALAALRVISESLIDATYHQASQDVATIKGKSGE